MNEPKPSLTALTIYLRRLKREVLTNHNGATVVWAADAPLLEAIVNILDELAMTETKE